MKMIYLDANSTTPMDPRVLERMTPYFLDFFGNPSSKTHSMGWDADLAVETARKEIATLLNATPKEIFFTSGATESNNLALRGIAEKFKNEKVHIISTLTEHLSNLETLKYLSSQGVEITLLKPNTYGTITAQQIESALKPHTRLVSVIWVNNEIGSINPILEIGNVCEAANISFHVDACQGLSYIPMDIQKNKIHLLSLSAHKMYGPKGVGALFVRQIPQRTKLDPILFGAGQEKGLRPGTLNVPGIVGLGETCKNTKNDLLKDANRIQEYRDSILMELLQLPFVQLNGHPSLRSPNNLNLTFSGIQNSDLIKKATNLALSTGSACSTGSPQPSHVLTSIGLSEDQIQSTLRIGLHKFLTQDDIQIAINTLKSAAIQLHERSRY